MSFDGNTLHHLVTEWNDTLKQGRIQKIYQMSRFDLLFVIHANKVKHQFLISSSPRYARAYITTRNYDKPDYPPTFCMFLRKQLEGGIIKDIQQVENDRIVLFTIEKRNELGDLSTKQMILEMMGRYSNIIITDEHKKILEAIKHSLPFDSENRTLFPGAIYEFPPTDKINPYNAEQLATFLTNPEHLNYRGLLQNILGFSPLIVHEVLYRYEEEKETLDSIFETILYHKNPTLISGDNDQYYSIDLHHIEGDRESFATMNQLLDQYYLDRDQVDVIKQYAKDLTTFVKNQIQRLLNKLDKLAIDLEQTNDMDHYRIQGELIQNNLHQIQKGDTSITCFNYYTNDNITIVLDALLTPIQNSAKYFKKYKKQKTSIPYINEQMEDAKRQLEYFYELESQFKYATINDVLEIKEELIALKYIKGTLPKRKKQKPHFDTYYDAFDIPIIVGKNNIQNEYITHKYAKHNEVWFHTKDAPGSHVVVRHPFPLEETTIRTAANLAAYHSKMRQSSSVPVDYTEIRYIKKVPGKTGSFVTYTNQKTIYIDPDERAIVALKKA